MRLVLRVIVRISLHLLLASIAVMPAFCEEQQKKSIGAWELQELAKTGVALRIDVTPYDAFSVKEIVKNARESGSKITLVGVQKFSLPDLKDFVKEGPKDMLLDMGPQ